MRNGGRATETRPKTLSAAFVRSVTRPGRYGDGRGGHGLSLLVKPMANGRTSKTWAQRLRIAGRVTNRGLGRYPLLGLSEARAAALKNARAIAQGLDPRGGGVPSFEEAVERVIDLHEPTWKDGARSAEIWRSSLRAYAMPVLGRLPVSDITTAHVLSTLTPIWNKKRETARRVRQRIGAVMKWAVAQRYRADNPAGDAIAEALPKANAAKTHMRGAPTQRGRGGAGTDTGVRGLAVHEARARIPDTDGGAERGSAAGDMGRDRHDGLRVDDCRSADEGAAGASCPADRPSR